MKVKVISWIENYRAFFGSLSADQTAAWSQVLYDNTGCKDCHIDEVVAHMCGTWDIRENGKPGVKAIMGKVFNLMGKGRVEFMEEASIVKRGKAMLDNCIKTDWNSMHDIICVGHQAWKIDYEASIKMWTKNISIQLEAYAKKKYGYDVSKVDVPDWKSVLQKVVKGMDPDPDDKRRDYVDQVSATTSLDDFGFAEPQDLVPF